MIRICLQNSLIACQRLIVLNAVFVQHAQIQQRTDVRRIACDRAFIKIDGRIVIAVAIVFHRQSEERAGMLGIRGYGPFEQRDHFRRTALQRRDRGPTLIQILGRLLDGARQIVERFQSGFGIAAGSQRFGPR